MRTIATYCLAAAWLLACAGDVPKPPPHLAVPNVLGMPLGQAHGTVLSAGLSRVDDLDVPCPSGPGPIGRPTAPVVVAQTPAAGVEAAKGSMVHLHSC
jgi:beta-lactam-binding protein with PASTA domain